MIKQDNPRIIIVGAGFSGIGLAIKLQQAGFTNLKIIERGSAVGGTWWFNTYPGIAVDVPTPLYSYSFALKPDWSHQFSPGSEIQEYIEDCAVKYDVKRYIQFSTEIINAAFDEKRSEWILTTGDGKEHSCKYLLGATGFLTEPKYPNIKGLQDFKGKIIHSGAWDHTYDFTDKTVAIIGTGSSGIQIIPELAKIVKHMTVFQRSAPWVLPRDDFEHGTFRKMLYKYLPFTQRIERFLIWSKLEYALTPLLIRQDKTAHFLRNTVLKIATKHRIKAIKDPELLRKVTPNYEAGCKRAIVSDDYYPALTRKNVELVTDPIDRITEKGVLTTARKEFPLDSLVFATGFDIIEKPWDMTGRGGITLKQYYKKVGGPEAYKGVTISGFPNFFMTFGPNTASGSMSALYAIEVEIDYIVQALKYFREKAITYFDVKKDVMDAFNKKLLNEMAPQTVWVTGCNSWYITDKGKLIAIWPGMAREYAKALSKFVPEEYELKN